MRLSSERPLQSSDVLGNWLPDTPPFAGRLIERLLGVDRLVELYATAERDPDKTLFAALLNQLSAHCHVEQAELSRIPAQGPVVVVSNHPFGMLDGVALGAVLVGLRKDARLLANRMLGIAPGFARHCIFVDPFGTRQAKASNVRAYREAARFLTNGGLLGVFPAGEVASWDPARQSVVERPWSPAIAALIRRAAATVIPVHFEGANSLPFHLLGMVHPFLRSARLPHEFFNKAGQTIRLRIGHPIAPAKLATFDTDADAIQYLRWRTELLSHRRAISIRSAPQRQAPLAIPVSPTALRRELDALPPAATVEANSGWRVIISPAQPMPLVMQEIGRVRELTFRAAGEGTGEPADLDRFDPHYLHLVLWNEADQRIAGGYRLGLTPDLLARGGARALYTSTLFHFDPRFFSHIGPAVELGRSFVHPAYQKQFAPLLLLWKGIGAWLARHPQTPVLFGAVSISNDYTDASRRLIVEYSRAQIDRDPLARLVRPRCPFRPQFHTRLDTTALRRFAQTLDDLQAPLADLEPDGKGVPILLRQYAKLGGRLLGFHVDSRFSHTLDGLILVDLRQSEPQALERYMTRAGAAAFLAYHADSSVPRLAG